MGSAAGRSIRRWRLTLIGAALLAVLSGLPAGVHAAAKQLPAGAETDAGAASPAPEPILPRRVFVLDRGRFTTFSVPFGPFGGDGAGINDRGQVVASYHSSPDARSCLRGFLRDRNGRFTRIDFPADGTTQLNDVNDGGQIVGNFEPSATPGICDEPRPLQGFVRDGRGRFTTIPVPGAQQVEAFGINNHGQVVGEYDTADGTAHGYLLDGGRITTIDGPPGAIGASVLAISDSGQMVGESIDGAGVLRAFSLSHGLYTTIDAPDAPFTFPFGVNDRGQIAGFTATKVPFDSPGNEEHGFVLRDGAGGPFTTVDVPGAIGATAVGDINKAGVVVGDYEIPAPSGAA